jgi:hypothetical protein
VSSSFESSISLKIEKMYSWNIQVILSDNLTNKTDKFTITGKDTKEDIDKKADLSIGKFLL